MAKNFTWDARKAEQNRRKHDIAFEEAVTVFQDRFAIYLTDESHSYGEFRLVTIGVSLSGRLLLVIYTDAGSTIRLISARRATKRERQDNEN